MIRTKLFSFSRKSAKRLRPFLWRWHRRLGLCSAIFLLLISVTGILLNHTSDLQLGSRTITQPSVLSFYGIRAPASLSYPVGKQWLSTDASNSLYLDAVPSGVCRGNVTGVARLGVNWVLVACEQELLLLSEQGQLVERIDQDFGLPVPVSGVGYCNEGVCLKAAQAVYPLDLNTLQWVPVESVVDWSEPAPLPSYAQKELMAAQLGGALSWERLIQDLHSGRIFGSFGVWFFDFVAVMLIFLGVSGVWLWYRMGRFR